MTTTASPRRSAAVTACSTASSVETTVRCSLVVPRTVTDTGSLGLRPCSTSAAALLATDAAVVISTSVPGAAASDAKLVPSSTRATVRGRPTATPA